MDSDINTMVVFGVALVLALLLVISGFTTDRIKRQAFGTGDWAVRFLYLGGAIIGLIIIIWLVPNSDPEEKGKHYGVYPTPTRDIKRK